MRAAALLFLALPALAIERPHSSHQWNLSIALFAGASAADAAYSWNLRELNPVLGRGEFGMRQAGIKIGLDAAIIGTEWLILRHHAGQRRFATWVNYSAAATTGAVAVRNWRIR